MKLDVKIDHELNGLNAFGISDKRAHEINDFLIGIIRESRQKKYKRSVVVERIVEFAESYVEAVVMYGYLESKRDEAEDMTEKIIGLIAGLSGARVQRKSGMIEIRDGEIHSMTGDEVPDEMVDSLKNLVSKLESIKPTGNMKVDEDGNIS